MTTIASPHGESDSKDVNTAARAAVLENKAVNAVDSNDGGVTDCYKMANECAVAVASTTDAIEEKRSFVKCISVVKEPSTLWG